MSEQTPLEVGVAIYGGYCYACPKPIEQGSMWRRERVGDEVPHVHRLVHHPDCPPPQPESVLTEVRTERLLQHAQWGEQNHPDGTGGEGRRNDADRARESCEASFEAGGGTWRHILIEEVCEAMAEHDPVALRAELIQVAAVAVAWVEAIDRRDRPETPGGAA